MNEAIKFIENGGEVRQEDSNDFPNCGGFDDVEELMENFPKEDWDYDEDNQDLFLHLIPAEEDYAVEPYKVGETVWATEKIKIGDSDCICPGDACKIADIRSDLQYIGVDGYKAICWPADKFCRCVLPNS